MAIKSVTAQINGQQVTLEYNPESQRYEATLTAPAKSSYPMEGHYYPVEITATDDAGNVKIVNDKDPSIGESLRLIVKEKVKPTIVILTPTSGQTLVTNNPEITAQLRDDDSGIDISTLVMKVDGKPVTPNKSASGNGYDISYTPAEALGDGSHSVSIAVSDFDGNAAAETATSFVVDTTPPQLSVTSPVDNFKTNKNIVAVVGKTNDATSSPVTITIKVNQSDTGTVEVGSSGDFTKNVTLAEGDNIIEITATDRVGKSSTVTRTVTLRTKLPVIQSATLTPNPADAGKTYVISVSVVEP